MIENFHKTTSPFSHIFKLHSYRSILSRYFATYSAIAGYLLTSFSHNNNNNNNNPICKAPECQKTSVALADRNSRAN